MQLVVGVVRKFDESDENLLFQWRRAKRSAKIDDVCSVILVLRKPRESDMKIWPSTHPWTA